MSRELQSNRLTTVTPKMAATWLGDMIQNRPLSRLSVKKYANDMLTGEWAINGETIKFDAKGRLIDGQHRLRACIESGTTFKTYVVRGLEADKAIHSIDSGKSRTKGDFLQFHGFKNANSLAAAAGVYAKIMKAQTAYVSPRKTRSTHPAARFMPEGPLESKAVLKRYIEANPYITGVVDGMLALQASVKGWLSFSCLAGFTAAAATLVDKERAIVFAQALAKGEGLTMEDPELRLRNYLIKQTMATGRKLTPDFQIIQLCRTWGYHITGTKLLSIGAVKPGSAIPKVIGPDESVRSMLRPSEAKKSK